MRFMTHGTVPTISFFPELLQVVMAKYGMMSTHRKNLRSANRAIKKFGRVYKRYPEGTAEEKDSISRYSMESEKIRIA